MGGPILHFIDPGAANAPSTPAKRCGMLAPGWLFGCAGVNRDLPSTIRCAGDGSFPRHALTDTVIEPTASPIGPLQDGESLIRRISRITGQPADTVRQRLRREYDCLGTNVRESMASSGVTPYVWCDRLRDFYARTDAFLYETIVWNLTHEKCKMQRWILRLFASRRPRPEDS